MPPISTITFRKNCQHVWLRSLFPLWLATCIDGVVQPYVNGAHAWEMSVVRVRRSWWKNIGMSFLYWKGKR